MGLDSVELLMAVEEDFSIQITERDAAKILTVDDLYKCVLSKLHHKPVPVDEAKIWQQLRAKIAYQGGLPLDKVVAEAKIVADLGIN